MKNKVLPSLVILFISLGIFLGFSIMDDNPHSSRTQEPIQFESIPLSPAPHYVAPDAIIFEDSLDGTNDTTSLKARGYLPYYRGTGPQGLTATWFQGNGTVFPSFNGPTSGYVAANYNVVTSINNIDSWLVLPVTPVGAGDTLSFYERSPTGSTWPDSMRVMYSAVGDSTPEGTWVELGRFKNSITAWTQHIYTAPTAGPNGRFALRYAVANGGPSGSNSNYIGVDWIRVYGSGSTPAGSFHWNATAGSGNTFPLGQSAGKFVNWLFPPGVFVNPTPCPVDSQIDTVWVRMYGTGTRTYTSLHVLMAQTTATNLTSGQFYAGPWDTVYYNASVTLTSPGANTWMPIVLQTPYPYDITKGLVVGIGQCSGSGSGMYVNQTTLTGTKRTWSIGGCPFAPYNSADSRNLCMGISVTPATGITPVSNIPDQFSLSQNYPNPFNPATTINFSIPKSGLVTLKVFDVLGQEVATLVNDPKVAGSYSVNFNGENLSSGVYFYRLEANDFVSVKRMLLVK